MSIQISYRVLMFVVLQSGWTALRCASYNGCDGVVGVLLKHNADSAIVDMVWQDKFLNINIVLEINSMLTVFCRYVHALNIHVE